MGNTPNVPSLSGKRVELDCALWVNPNLAEERQGFLGYDAIIRDTPVPSSADNSTVIVPAGHRQGGVPKEAYDAYRAGLDSFCVDVVITTNIGGLKGTPAVLAMKRVPNVCFAGKWWMMGGAVHSYRPLFEFIQERAERECGVKPGIRARIGLFRTAAPDILACTTNLCLLGQVWHDQIVDKFRADSDHSVHRLLTLENLKNLPEDEKHWYPMFCFQRALETM